MTLFRYTLPLRIRLDVYGRSRIPKRGPGILYANHLSILDPIIIGMISPRPVKFLAASYLFRIPCLGRFLRWAGVEPLGGLRTTRETLKQAQAHLSDDGLVGLFPQGGVRRPNAPLTIEPGLIHLTRRSDAPVIPIFIVGTERVLPTGSYIPAAGSVRVCIGEPFLLSEAPAKTQKEQLALGIVRLQKEADQEGEH